ncbi:MAG: glycosyltransferase family 2 protein [Planctomycetota bacterium]|nr:glycosyltransferase family 2 protein [Planctomycetota bacterium]
MLTLQVILVLALIVCFGAAVYWMVAYWRMRRALSRSISMREGVDLPEPRGGWPRVAVVIPAHNEEAMIERCARGIMEQDYPELSAVFVLDRCTDRTESRLRALVGDDPRFSILTIDECPEDWAGKCNAARHGGAQALADGAEFLLFSDADTEFDQRLVRSSVGLALREEADLLSVLSTLTTTRWDERVVQPVAILNLVRMHPPDLVNRRERPRAFANGQFMLFSSDIYRTIGGHESVHQDLLEDIAFARMVRGNGGRGVILNADGMLKVSMYDSLAQLEEGWKRIFIEVARRHPRRLVGWGIRSLAAGALIPLVQVLAVVLGSILYVNGDPPALPLAVSAVGLGLLAQLLVLGSFYRTAGTPLTGIPGYPLGCLLVGRLMLAGASDLRNGRPIRWGGRDYVLTPR